MSNTLNIEDLAASKREYRDALFYELKSKGYNSSEANSIIEKSDFVNLLEKFPDEVFHESVTNMADDMIRKVMRMDNK